MSSPSRRPVIAANARKDIRGILLSTTQTWGSTQRDRYKTDIDDALDLIRDHPHIGAKRDSLGNGIRARPIGKQGQHVIYDRVEPKTVRVLRVLHVKMDTAEELATE